MTSRERVLAAMEHKPVDRVPLMLWIEPRTMLNMALEYKKPRNPLDRAAARLIGRLSRDLPREDLRNGAVLLVRAMEERYVRELGADIAEFQWGPFALWLRGVRIEKGNVHFKDMYGNVNGFGESGMEQSKKQCLTAKELDRYRFPDVSSPIYYNHFRTYRALHPDICLSARCPGVLDWGMVWQGIEQIYAGLIEYPEVVKRFFDRVAEHSIQIIRGSLKAGADMMMIADDYGDQRSLMISKPMWEEFIYPGLRRQIEAAHEYGGKALLHSCGTVAPLLDRFAEAELDALHPFQSLPGNDLEEAKKNYGGRLAFFVGIDVQRMPDMPPDAVRDEIIRLYRIGNRGGGMVFATANYMMPDTPVENIRIMFKTIRDIQEGRVPSE
ncbi:MAG: uroporphyrinogen decarboxylase family protein [bacterium]